MGFDKTLMPSINTMGRIPRTFICMRCNKKSVDHTAGYKEELKDGTKLETENVDLCNKCFKLTQSEYRQTEFIKDKLGKGELKDEDLHKIQDSPNFKRELYESSEGLINKKGHAKKFKEDLIKSLLKDKEDKK
jgi:hypothetical protein